MIQFRIYRSYAELDADHWNLVLGNKNLYLSLDYLSSLEETLRDKVEFHYILFYERNSDPIGLAVTQTVSFIDKGFTENKQICAIRNKIKKRFVTGNGTRILTCGNPFATGENGYIFKEKYQTKLVLKSLLKALKDIEKLSKTSVILFKEFYQEKNHPHQFTPFKGFTPFEIDVNMVMEISSHWKQKDDYYQALNTKFRSKAKNAYHKSHDLDVRNFSIEEIEKYKEDILRLYLSVVAKSPFDYGNLNAEAFISLKRNLSDKFLVKGYLLKDKLVGFSSAFVFDSVLDANFVGIDYELNQELAVYQRMLYDFVDFAILNQCKEIRFGRTAEEIKSSIGAKPVNMVLLIKHRNIFTNYILKSIIGKNKPSTYSLRNPFKSGAVK